MLVWKTWTRKTSTIISGRTKRMENFESRM